MNSTTFFTGKKRIVVASSFSGMDLFLLSFIKAGLLGAFAVERNFWPCILHRANFFDLDGIPIMAPFIEISEEEYRSRRETKPKKSDDKSKVKVEDLSETVGKVDGKFVRAREIQEFNGRDVRAAIEEIYGKDVIIIFIGGPVCYDLTGINSKKNKGEGSRNNLMFTFLNFLEGLNADIAIMEQVPEINQKGNEELYSNFLDKARTLPFQFAEREMCSLHYHGNQMRWRYVMMFVHDKYKQQPIFPTPDTANVKRVRDFLDIDHFISGHYVDRWKTKNHFMCTVTSSSPSKFEKEGKVYSPSNDELLLCFDVEKGEYNIPSEVPVSHVKKAIGNAVCLSLGSALINTILTQILKVYHVGDGFFQSLPIQEEEL